MRESYKPRWYEATSFCRGTAWVVTLLKLVHSGPDKKPAADAHKIGMVKPTEKTNLDILRSFAVLSVLADHTLQALGIPRLGPFSVILFGLFGVYLFFLHTSLVLMWSLERRPHTLDFYIRRVFRIYPLAIVTVIVVVLLRLHTAQGPGYMVEAPRDAFTVLTNLLLVQNIFHRPAVEAVMWSLPLEVMMYVVLPALFVFARRERTLWPVLVLWGAAALAGHAVSGEPNAAIVVAAPFFLSGIVAYVGFMDRIPRLRSWLVLPLLLGLAIACSMNGFATTNVVSWAAVLLLGLILPSFDRRPTRCGFVHLIGSRSIRTVSTCCISGRWGWLFICLSTRCF